MCECPDKGMTTCGRPEAGNATGMLSGELAVCVERPLLPKSLQERGQGEKGAVTIKGSVPKLSILMNEDIH